MAGEVGLPRGPSFVLAWFLRYTRDPYGVFGELARRFGDPFLVRLGETPGTVATGCPEGVRAIIGAEPGTLAPWRPPSLAVMTEHSLFMQAGERHAATRRLLAPMFAGGRQADHAAVMQQVVDRELDRLAPGPVVAHDLALELTLRIILAAIFGDGDEGRVARFRAAAGRVLDDRGPTMLYVPLLRRLSPRWRRITRGVGELRALVADELRARRRAGGGGADLLGHLLRVRKPDGSPMADIEIAVHLADLVVAGHETSTVAVAWACYELCRHPSVMARLVAELDGHAGSPAALPYMQAVCQETLRLHPPLVFLTREVQRPLRVGGHQVPPGHGVSIVVPLAHRNPQVYRQPERFRPERFLGPAPRPEHYLPFGGGAQRCLGATFAQQEMAIILAGLLRRFSLRLRRRGVVRARPRVITVAPLGGVELVLERRTAAAAVAREQAGA